MKNYNLCLLLRIFRDLYVFRETLMHKVNSPIYYSFKVKQVAKKKLSLANIQIVKMFELFENERTKTIHSSIVHSSEKRGLCFFKRNA